MVLFKKKNKRKERKKKREKRKEDNRSKDSRTLIDPKPKHTFTQVEKRLFPWVRCPLRTQLSGLIYHRNTVLIPGSGTQPLPHLPGQTEGWTDSAYLDTLPL